jgi:hypothetical protein
MTQRTFGAISDPDPVVNVDVASIASSPIAAAEMQAPLSGSAKL